MKGSKTTTAVLSQIAVQANVSLGTVSRAFNNSNQIPSETRSRIFSVARRLGFRPRVGIRNKQIALVTELPQNTVMGGSISSLTLHICFALSRNQIGVTMITKECIDKLFEYWFDGVIEIIRLNEHMNDLENLNLPVIRLYDDQSDRHHTVFTNNYDTGLQAGRYLIGKGHRKIAVIQEMDDSGQKRFEGIGVAMKEAEINTEKALLNLSGAESLHLAAKQLIDANCTAVWVPSEELNALKVNWLIQELAGRKVPEEISLLGSETPGISEFMRPALTTFAQPLREMAEKAVEIVINEHLSVPRKINFPIKLIERNSVFNLK